MACFASCAMTARAASLSGAEQRGSQQRRHRGCGKRGASHLAIAMIEVRRFDVGAQSGESNLRPALRLDEHAPPRIDGGHADDAIIGRWI